MGGEGGVVIGSGEGGVVMVCWAVGRGGMV